MHTSLYEYIMEMEEMEKELDIPRPVLPLSTDVKEEGIIEKEERKLAEEIESKRRIALEKNQSGNNCVSDEDDDEVGVRNFTLEGCDNWNGHFGPTQDKLVVREPKKYNRFPEKVKLGDGLFKPQANVIKLPPSSKNIFTNDPRETESSSDENRFVEKSSTTEDKMQQEEEPWEREMRLRRLHNQGKRKADYSTASVPEKPITIEDLLGETPKDEVSDGLSGSMLSQGCSQDSVPEFTDSQLSFLQTHNVLKKSSQGFEIDSVEVGKLLEKLNLQQNQIVTPKRPTKDFSEGSHRENSSTKQKSAIS